MSLAQAKVNNYPLPPHPCMHACLVYVTFELALAKKTAVKRKRILCFLSIDSSSTSSLVGSPSHVVPPDGNGANLSGTGNIKKLGDIYFFSLGESDKRYDPRFKENVHIVKIWEE